MADAPDKKRKKDKKDKKEKKRRRKEEDAEQTEEQRMKADTALAMIRFRNYTPRDKNLRVFVMPKPKIENKLDLEELSKPLSDSNAIMDIAPKKPNWDLKRDVQRKLQRLEKRTQRAVIGLLQQRVASENQTGEELADAVETRAREAAMDLDEDD